MAQNTKQSRIKKLLQLMAVGVIVIVGLGLTVFLVFAVTLPEPTDVADRFVLESTKIYDRTGEVVLYDIFEEERRTVISFEDIPNHVKEAAIATEDQNFYDHPGIDIKAIVRAFLTNVRTADPTGQGGSTITQQFIKNSILSPERSYVRKIKEAILALELERRYSKDEILGFYLNQIAYGSNAYGIESAAQTFFNKPAEELTVAEAALLAALPKAPTYFSPYGSHAEQLMQRKNFVLQRMYDLGFLTNEEFVDAREQELEFSEARTGIKAPHFVFYIQEQLEEKYGPDFLAQKGLRIVTTLDWELQERAQEIVTEHAERNDNFNAFNAALVAMDPQTGQILSMIGSRDFFADPLPEGCTPGVDCQFEPNVNVAQRKRQPGSAFKPFVYATAFERGYTDNTILFDVFTEFNVTCDSSGSPQISGAECYHPRNFDGVFRGPLNIRTALANSINVPAVKALYLAGIDNVIRTAEDVGVTTFEDRERYGLSLVLGGAEVRLTELTAGYSVLANDGVRNPATGILRIEDNDGNVLEEFEEQPVRVMDAQITRIISDILSDNEARTPVFGPNNRLTFTTRDVAAKTGSTNDFRDGWTFGYTPTLTVGVWSGNNNNEPMVNAPGVSVSGPLWRAFLEEAFLQKDEEGNPKFAAASFTPPDPSPRNKPILNGEYRINGGAHTILHYIDKNDPLGATTGVSDPMYPNWEAAVRRWAGGGTAAQDGVVVITEPLNNDQVSGSFIVRASGPADADIQRVEFYLDEIFINSFAGTSESYAASYPAPSPGEHVIRVRAVFRDGSRPPQESRIIIQADS